MLLNGKKIRPEQIAAIARGESTRIQVDPAVLASLGRSYANYERKAKTTQIYGTTTGLGAKKTVLLVKHKHDPRETITATATRTDYFGALAPNISRAMLAIQINSLLNSNAPVRPELIRKLVDIFNNFKEYGDPHVPAISNGTGDLNPAAIFAEWWLEKDPDFVLKPGEDLALISGNHYSDAMSAIVTQETYRLMDVAYVVYAASAEAFRIQSSAIDEEVAKSRPIPELATAIHNIRSKLEGSKLFEEGAARSLQDPTSFRSFPQVAAAVEHQLAELVDYLSIEMNSYSQNPLYVAEDDRVVHNANFDTTQHSITLSGLTLSLAKFADISFKRLSKLCDPNFNGATDGFGLGTSPKSGIQSRNLTNIAGQALTNVVFLAQRNITQSLSVGFQNSIEDSNTNVFQQLQDAGKLLSSMRVLLSCELAAAIVGIFYRIEMQEISRDDLSPIVGEMYDAIRDKALLNGKAFNVDELLSALDDPSLFPVREPKRFAGSLNVTESRPPMQRPLPPYSYSYNRGDEESRIPTQKPLPPER